MRSVRERTRRKSPLVTYRIRLEVASFCVDNKGHVNNRTDDFFKSYLGRRLRDLIIKLFIFKFAADIRHFVF